MPRNHRSSRPATPARAAPAPNKPQTRSASTAAAPAPTPAAQAQPTYVPQQQGIMSQIATTAAGVAAGHVAGRMVMGLFGGSESSGAPVEQAQQQSTTFTQDKNVAPQCQEYTKMFLSCMDRNGNDHGMCTDYLEMMKSCQQQYSTSSNY